MKNPYKKSWQNENETMKAISWDEGYEAGLTEQFEEPIVPPDDRLMEFYKKKGYDVCPVCGRERRETALTGCPPGSHYGSCSIPDGNDTIADDTNDTYSDPHGTVFTY